MCCFTLEGIVINDKGKKNILGMPKWKDINNLNCPQFCYNHHRALAILTGEKSNITVIDFDLKDGLCSYDNVIEDFPDLKNCYTVRTWSGGYHVYCLYDKDINTTVNAFECYSHIDIRNDEAIVFAPPTKVFKNNAIVGEYQKLDNTILPFPVGLKEKLKQNNIAFIIKAIKNLEVETEMKNIKNEETNNESEIETIEVETVKTVKVDENLEEARLKLLNLQKCWAKGLLNDYDNWMKFTFCIFNKLSEEGYDVWNEISSKYDGYDKQKNLKFWENIKKTSKKTDKKLGWGRLFEWAKQGNPLLFDELFPSNNIDWGRLTDLTFALMMEKLYFKGKIVFTGKNKELEGYYFNDIYWKEIGINNAEITKSYFQKLYFYYMTKFNFVKESFKDEIASAIILTIKSLDSAKRRSDIIKVLKQEYYMADVKWNTNNNLFAFDDCIYDLEKGTFIMPHPEQYINVSCGYELGVKYDVINKIFTLPNLKVETEYIEKFLTEIMSSNETKHYLKKVMSSFLRQINAEEKCYFWLGKGRNGKGTLSKLLNLSLGNYYGELNIEYYTNYDKGVDSPNANLASIQNARLINTAEVGEVAGQGDKAIRFLTDKFKKITGGDTITTRKLFSNEPIKFVAGNPLVQTNMMPEIVGIEKKENISLRERVEILEFPYSFVNEEEYDGTPYKKKKDITLKDRWDKEEYKKAFVIMLLNYYKVYKAEGLKPPEEVKQSKIKYFTESNKLLSWLKENLVKVDGIAKENVLLMNDLYYAFVQEGNKITKKLFLQGLEETFGKAKDNGGYGCVSVDKEIKIYGYDLIA